MKKIFFAILILLWVSAAGLSAQTKMTEEQKKEAKAKYEAYQAKLNLTEEQSPKVEEINLSYFEGLSALKATGGSKLSKFRKLKDLGSERDKKMKAVLTEEQYEIYKQQQGEMKEQIKNNRRT